MVEIKHKALNTPTAVVALVNGMIGGSILVLPLTSYTAGWADTIFIILITAIFSFYSCYICIIHLGDQKDLDSALLRHFNGNKFLKIFYDFCVWIGMVFALILYFDLIIIQWEGLVPPYEFTYVNAIVNGGLILLWCVLLKFYDFGAHMMGYGIASIAGYLIFLIWVMATRPSGPKTPEPFGTGVAGFAAMMGNAFSIQGFFIPVMKSHPNPTRHVFILFLAYLIGTLTYYYIAFMGSYGIANRKDFRKTGTIESYFESSQWQVKLLEAIYLFHLYSVFPEYMIVCKKRFFSMFGLRQSGRKHITAIEFIYIAAIIAFCLLISILNINLDVIIDINGAVLGFCFVYLLPTLLHIRCIYFPKGKRSITELALKEMVKAEYESSIDSASDRNSVRTIKTEKDSALEPSQVKEDHYEQKKPQEESPDRRYQQVVEIEMQQVYSKPVADDNQSPFKQQNILEIDLRDGKLTEKFTDTANQPDQEFCFYYCGYEKPNLMRQIGSISMLVLMLLMGLFIMVNGLIQVVDMIRSS